MLATYGVDVLDPAVSLRRVHVLATRLPSGSLPAMDSPAAWSTEAHLMARLNDAIDLLIWVTLRVHNSKVQRPKPMPRPGGARRRPGQASAGGQRVSWVALAGALKSQGMVTDGG